MKGYIDKEKAIEAIRLTYCKDCNSYNGVRCRACEFDDAMSEIEGCPTADVVEVVRCKDCKYWEHDKRSYNRGYHFGECTCPHWEGSSVWDRHDTTIDDYCSQGERKEQK